MSSSARNAPAVADTPHLPGPRLSELISAVAAAPDFSTGVRFLVAQLADEVGAPRAWAFMLDATTLTLDLVAAVGAKQEPLTVPLANLSDPLVLSTMTLTPFSAGSERHKGKGEVQQEGPWTALALSRFIAIPFPQPQSWQVPPFAPLSELQRGIRMRCDAHLHALGAPGEDDAARAGLSPCGVVVLDADCHSDEMLAPLFDATRLAGPVLWRMSLAEDYQRSTQQLDKQSSLLTAIVNSLPDPIVIINAQHDIVVQNRRAELLLSLAENDSEGRRRAVEINNLLFTSHLSKAAIAGGVTSGARELNMVDPNEGTDLLFEVLTQPLNDAGEGATVSVLRDVTDLRLAAGELEQQVQRVKLAEFDAKRERDRLNLILANVADPILVTDDQSNIILMNRKAEQLFTGISAAGMLSEDQVSTAVRSNDTKFTTFISDFIMAPDHARREQMSLLTADGSGREFQVEVVSGKIMDRRGEPIAIVSVLHDLTEQVENERLYKELKKFSGDLEARVRAATADLAEQNIRLQWQSRELENASRLKSEFLANMSHELRTPINALIGYTALMLDRIYGEITSRQEEGLTRIQAAAHHLLVLINDILDLAKIEAGRMPLHLDEVPLQEVFREIDMQADALMKRKGLTYHSELPAQPTLMYTDRTKVKQILLNLLSNAVKFTHAGSVTLSAVEEGALVRLDVRDTGIGIRREDLEAIWEDFRQVDQSRTREFGGTGLGLSITRKLVGALGGQVRVRSEYGHGSTFTVCLPIRTDPPPEGAMED